MGYLTMDMDYVRGIENELKAFKYTKLTPEEIKDHKEMFEAYRHVCGGKSPEEIKALIDADEQGLLHKAPVPNGTDIYYIYEPDEIYEPDMPICIVHDIYNYGITEYQYGELDKNWFLSEEAARQVLKGGEAK